MLTVNRADLTVTADPQVMTYDGQVFTGFTATVSGFVNNETDNVVSGVAGFTGSAVTAIDASTTPYTITPTLHTLSAANYAFTNFENGTLTINPANITYAIGNDRQTYGYPVDLATDLGTTIWTGVNNETLALTYTSDGNTNSATVGAYPIDGTVSDGSGSASNYNVTLTPGTLTVAHFAVINTTVNASDVDLQFNAPVNLTNLSLFSTTPAVVLENVSDPANPQTVAGSLVWNAANDTASFVATSGVLPAGNYSLTLASGNDAFNNTVEPLNGTAGSNFTDSFTVAPSTEPVLTLPNFARGPGQSIDVAANGTAATNGVAVSGLPVFIDNAAGAYTVDFELNFDSTLMTVNGVALANSMPAGWNVTSQLDQTDGALKVEAQGTTPLTGGLTDLVQINATVPTTAPYGSSEVLRLTNVSVNGGAAIGAEAFHTAAFLGDVTGDGSLSSSDASEIAQYAVGLVNGFTAYPLTDPVIIGDVTGDGTLSSLDASYIARWLVDESVPQIPTYTALSSDCTGADPTISLGGSQTAEPGAIVTMPVAITDDAYGLESADLYVTYDPTLLRLPSGDVTLGSDLQGNGWSLVENLGTPGIARFALYADNTGIATHGATGSVLHDVQPGVQCHRSFRNRRGAGHESADERGSQ